MSWRPFGFKHARADKGCQDSVGWMSKHLSFLTVSKKQKSGDTPHKHQGMRLMKRRARVKKMPVTYKYFYLRNHLVNELHHAGNRRCFQLNQSTLAEVFAPDTQAAQPAQLFQIDFSNSVLATHVQNSTRNVNYSVYGYSKQTLIPPPMKGFNGYNRDIFTDLYPLGLGHRFFSTTLLRFTSPDKLSPFGQGGINSYCYCQGDPVNFSDPEGTFISRLLKYIGTATKRRKINLHSNKDALIDASNSLIDASNALKLTKAIEVFYEPYKKSKILQPGPEQLSERARHYLFYTNEIYAGRRWSYSEDPVLTTLQVEHLNETWEKLQKSEPGKISEWRGQ